MSFGAPGEDGTNGRETARRPAPRKVLLYTHALAGGGAERALALLASGLARRGHDVIFAADYRADENEGFLDAAVRRVELGANHAQAVVSLARVLRLEKPDISISALGASNLKHAVAAVLAGRRRHAILSYHGFFRSEPRPLSRLSFLLTPFLTRVTARTVAVSGALREDLVRTWRANPNQTRHIQNPVVWGVAGPTPTEESLRRREPIVLACGRLTADKNFLGLVRAFAKVERRDARLVIVGEGEERGAIEAEIARLGLTGRVELPGYVAEPWTYYSRAACLAVSSRVESFGMVIVEALAHGLPVVATDCGGPREILDESNVGILVPVGDEAAMAAGINAALANPGDPRPRVGRARSFSQDASVASYESLFDEVGRHASAAMRVIAMAFCALCVVF